MPSFSMSPNYFILDTSKFHLICSNYTIYYTLRLSECQILFLLGHSVLLVGMLLISLKKFNY